MQNEFKLPAVVGKKLIIQAPFQLSEICVVTGRTDDLVPRHQEFTIHSGLADIAGILGPAAHVAVDLLTRRKVTLSYFISRPALVSHRRWMICSWLSLIGFFLALAAGILTPLVWLITVVAPVCAIYSILVYYTKVRQVHVDRANDWYAEVSGMPMSVMQAMVPPNSDEFA